VVGVVPLDDEAAVRVHLEDGRHAPRPPPRRRRPPQRRRRQLPPRRWARSAPVWRASIAQDWSRIGAGLEQDWKRTWARRIDAPGRHPPAAPPPAAPVPGATLQLAGNGPALWRGGCSGAGTATSGSAANSPRRCDAGAASYAPSSCGSMGMALQSLASPSASGLFPTLKPRLGLRVGVVTGPFAATCWAVGATADSAWSGEEASVPLAGSETADMHLAPDNRFPGGCM
jgi:hypothetical protein